MTDEKYKIMLAGYIDGELTAEEKADFEKYLTRDPEIRKELQTFQKLKEVTKAMKYADIPEAVWDGYWQDLYRRMERGLGWIFLSLGIIALAVLGIFHFCRDFLFDAEIPIVLRLATVLTALGTIILLVSVIRERLFAWRRDRYREVQR